MLIIEFRDIICDVLQKLARFLLDVCFSSNIIFDWLVNW